MVDVDTTSSVLLDVMADDVATDELCTFSLRIPRSVVQLADRVRDKLERGDPMQRSISRNAMLCTLISAGAEAMLAQTEADNE